MNRKTGLIITLVAVALTCMALPAHAGWIEVDRHSGTSYFSGAKLKHVPEDGTSWTIIDAQKGTVTMVNHEEQSYTEVDLEEFCETMSSLMTEMMAGMPPEQRAMMEQMMGSQGEKRVPDVTVERKEGAELIAAHKTTLWSVAADGRPYRDIWIADDVAVTEEVRNFIKKTLDMGRKMKDCMASARGTTEADPEDSPRYAELMMKGWVMKEVNREDGEVEREVVKLEEKTIPASEFTVPAGYRKAEFLEMMGSQMK